MTATIRDLLSTVPEDSQFSEKLKGYATILVGSPYTSSPLIGAHDIEEQLCLNVNEFDCVTYVETVLAFARSTSEDEFSSVLTSLRYLKGNVSWLDRNHYMADWIKRNEEAGAVADLTAQFPESFCVERNLSLLENYPSSTHNLPFCSNEAALSNPDLVTAGDIVLFGSHRETLDVFHMGLIFPENNQLFLTHASRKAGAVIREPLATFCEREDCFGLQIVRPLPIT